MEVYEEGGLIRPRELGFAKERSLSIPTALHPFTILDPGTRGTAQTYDTNCHKMQNLLTVRPNSVFFRGEALDRSAE
jgi:hypothetical protein